MLVVAELEILPAVSVTEAKKEYWVLGVSEELSHEVEDVAPLLLLVVKL